MSTRQLKDDLRERFGVHDGQFFAVYRFKNLNWYLNDDHFCFGDIRTEDIERLPALLEPGEVLTLGWKDLPPNQKEHDFFGNGGGLWLRITSDGPEFVVEQRARRTV